MARPLRHKTHCSLFRIKRSTISRLLALRLLDRAPPNCEDFFLPGTHSTARNDSAKAVDSFRAPGNGRGRDSFRLTGGLAKPNAVLEQIWNTFLRSVLAASRTSANCHLRNFFRRIDADNPSKPTNTPIIIWLDNSSLSRHDALFLSRFTNSVSPINERACAALCTWRRRW